MPKDALLREAKKAMQKGADALINELRGIRTGHANTALVEHVKVDYYGTMTPLNQIANISVPEARMIVVKPFDQSSLGAIEKALLAADLGINPNSDGKVIRLTVPPLSEENRKHLVTKVKEVAEHTRVSIRNVRRDANKKVDQALKDKTLSEDIAHDLKDEIQNDLKSHEKDIDEIVEKKSKEIMEI